MRVVSLTCSNTEIVCALGLAELLVGVDNHSDYPEEVVRRLPRVGPDLQIDVERVAALKPDLVLASLTVPGHERVVEALERAKLPFIAPAPTRLEHVFSDIELIANRLGQTERAAQLTETLRAAFTSRTSARTRRPKLLVEWWPKPVIVPGLQSWVTDLIEAAGGENPFANRDVKSTPISDEEACAAAPDAVIVSWCGVRFEKYRLDVVQRRSAWAGIPALRNSRLFRVPESFLGRPGPRLALGLRELQSVVDQLIRDMDEGFEEVT